MASKHALLVLVGLVAVWLYIEACPKTERSAGRVEVRYGAPNARVEHLPGAPLDPFAVNLRASTQRDGQRSGPVEQLANSVARLGLESVAPLPPRALAQSELGPQALWRPTWQGVQSFFTKEDKCLLYRPEPRLWATSLNELHERRARLNGIEAPEPLSARQTMAQFLTMDVAFKRDVYTRPARGGLIGGACLELASQIPDSVTT